MHVMGVTDVLNEYCEHNFALHATRSSARCGARIGGNMHIRLGFLGMLLLFIAGIFFVFGRQVGLDSKPGPSKRTVDHLSTAMHGEAFAYAKYLLYAQHARQNGNEELAKLFEDAAQTERFQHFAEEAQLAALVGSDRDNLKDAIEGEAYEVNTMYFRFAHEAELVGDRAAADRFSEIRQDEMGHRDAFIAALQKLNSSPAGK
jgi:rubrerythrin